VWPRKDKEEEKKKKVRKQSKPRKRLTLSFIFVSFILVLLALNFALLLPPQLGSLFYELEIWLISFLRAPITFQTWLWMLLGAIIFVAGYHFMPVLTVMPNEFRRMETYVLLDAWDDGVFYYFKTLSGKVIKVYAQWVGKTGVWKFSRYYISMPLHKKDYGGVIVYESDALEISILNHLIEERDMHMESEAKLLEILKRYEPYMSKEDLAYLLNAMRGVKEE